MRAPAVFEWAAESVAPGMSGAGPLCGKFEFTSDFK